MVVGVMWAPERGKHPDRAFWAQNPSNMAFHTYTNKPVTYSFVLGVRNLP